MNGFQIIEYSPDLYDQVNRLWNETGLGGSHRGDNPQIILDTIKAGGHLSLIVNSERDVIGTSWLTNDKRRTYIHHFGIKEGFRRMGLAKILLQHSLTLAIADGYQVKLEVHVDNEAAINLYKSYGFSYLGDYMVLIKREIL